MKALQLNKLVKKRDLYKKKKIKVVLAHGVFDVIHVGHILYFEEAKKKNRVLIVSVTSDKYVDKGENRPVFNLKERIKILSSIDSIDHIVVSDSKSSINVIKKLKPDYYIKGKDYRDIKFDIANNLDAEIKAVNSVKGKFIFSKSKLYSSSKIIGINSKKNKNKEVKEFIKKKKIDLENLKTNIIKNFNSVKNEKILCLGDPIIDTYRYVETLGKSAKNNILSTKKIKQENYGGGIILVLNYLSNFLNKIDYLTYSNNKNDQILNKYLNKKINLIKLKSDKINIVKKIRYVDNYSKNKLFQVNEDEFSDANNEKKIASKFKKIASKYDKILIFDFGHGFVNDNLVKEINKFKSKCYINCQSNSSNFGFNIANKYKSAVAISVDELEFRLSNRNKYEKIGDIIKKNKSVISKFKYFIVTQGKIGCYITSKGATDFIPTLLREPKDSTGCGDIFFSTFFLTDIYKNFKNIEKGIVCHMAAGLHTKKEGNENFVNHKILSNFSKTFLN